MDNKQIGTKDKMIQPYWSDNELYVLWKFVNSNRFSDTDLLNFETIRPPHTSSGLAAATLLVNLERFGIELDGIKFHKDVYEKFSEEKYKLVNDYIKEKPDEQISRGIKNVLKGNFNTNDLASTFVFQKFGMIDYFEFNKPNQEKIKKISDYLNTYIKWFTNNQLHPEKKSYYKFEKQKSVLLYTLKRNIDKYGNIFVFYYPEQEIPFDIDRDYLFIHSLAASEYLGYIQVENIWIYDWETPPEKQTEQYKIRVVIQPKLLKELEESRLKYFEKPNKPTISINKNTLVKFDSQNSELEFLGKKIIISKTKNSDAHYLLITIFKDKKKIWNYDEIYGDGYLASDPDKYIHKFHWRKIYNAAYSANEKIAKETTIKDFLSITKKTISINKKYLK